jgi:hypothetical protein
VRRGKLVERCTARVFLDMRHAAAKAGVHIVVVSGLRTMKEQRRLYSLCKHGKGNLAAPPDWLANHGRHYDFKRTVPSEAWHWEHW